MHVEVLDALENAARHDSPGWHGTCLAREPIDEYRIGTAWSPQLGRVHISWYVQLCFILDEAGSPRMYLRAV
jgi:hypothetical protein